jgi:hypothetical protein
LIMQSPWLCCISSAISQQRGMKSRSNGSLRHSMPTELRSAQRSSTAVRQIMILFSSVYWIWIERINAAVSLQNHVPEDQSLLCGTCGTLRHDGLEHCGMLRSPIGLRTIVRSLRSSDGILCRRAATKSALQSSSGILCRRTKSAATAAQLPWVCRNPAVPQKTSCHGITCHRTSYETCFRQAS